MALAFAAFHIRLTGEQLTATWAIENKLGVNHAFGGDPRVFGNGEDRVAIAALPFGPHEACIGAEFESALGAGDRQLTRRLAGRRQLWSYRLAGDG